MPEGVPSVGRRSQQPISGGSQSPAVTKAMARFILGLELGRMRRSLRYAGAVGLMVLGSAPLTPQRTGQQSAGPVIRVTVDLVQLDAVATDSQGHYVTDLKPEDFQILEDGKPQVITRFMRARCRRLRRPSPQPQPEQRQSSS
jgi:hypothetical protein